MTDATIEITAHLPDDVTLIDGKLMRHPESAPYGPEMIQCAARTVKPKNGCYRCKLPLEYGQICFGNGSVKIGEHWVGVREAPRLTPENLDRWCNQLCLCHYAMLDRVTYAVPPLWTRYDAAPIVERVNRIETLISEQW